MVLVFTLPFFGCEDEQKADQKHPETVDNGDDDDDDTTTPPDPTVTGNPIFQNWCDKAAEISTTGTELKELFDQLCLDAKPTNMLTSSLISQAYEGSDDPKIKTISGPDNDTAAKTTALTLGTGINLPISIEDHFTKVGPKASDPEIQAQVGADQNATVSIEVLETFTAEGTYHVRGWKIKNNTKKKIGGFIDFESNGTVRSDQYELIPGEAYMYTSYYVEDGTGVIRNSLLTAGVKVGEASYLLTIGYVKVDNLGIPGLADDSILETAQELAKSMYKEAEKEK
jgi:hypothetical protein